MKNFIIIIGWLATVCCGKHFLIETMDADTDSEGSDYMEVEGRDFITSEVSRVDFLIAEKRITTGKIPHMGDTEYLDVCG